jgi:hypothetical protein
MTYAGYQRYETPNLGAVAVEQIDKQKAFDLKQQELDRAQKYKDDTLAAKAAAAEAKAAADKAKQDAENAKLIDVKEKEFQSSVIETGSVITSPDADGLFTNFSNTQLKPEVKELSRKLNAHEIDQQGFNAGLNAINSGVKGVGETFKTFEAATEKINTNANSNPLEKWVANSVYNEVIPSEDNQKALMKDADGVYYVQNSKGDRHDISVLKSVTALTQHPVINFDEDAKKNVIELIPKNSMETLRKGGGTQTDIDQAKNDKFEKFANTWINQVTADDYSAANAYMHYMNDGNVAFIKKGASEEERKKAVLALGVDEDKWEENQKYLVEVSFDNKNKVPMPILTKEQKAELKKEMKSNVTAMAVKSKAISTPSTTTVNIKQTVENKVNEQANQKYVKLYEGSKGALNQFRSEIAAANGMASSAKPKWEGKDREWLEWDADEKGLILWTNTSKDKMNEEWQWDYILLEGDEAWPDPTAHIADKINQAKESANARAAGGATPKQSEQ